MSIDPEIKEFFSRVSTGSVSDAMKLLGIDNWMDDILPIDSSKKIFGRAFTIHMAPNIGPGGHQKTYAITNLCHEWEEGDILVFDGCAGEIDAMLCANYGAGGMVIGGKCRDYEEMGRISIPIFCNGVKIRLRTNEKAADSFNVPIDMAGAHIKPGDYIFGNSDGIIVIPKDRIRDIMYQAEMVEEVEAELKAALARKCTIEELNVIREKKKKPRD